MSKPVISVENLSKAYRIGVKDEIPDTLVGAMTSVIRSPFKNLQRLRRLDTFTGGPNGNESADTLWALKDVSFDVQEGEVVGIIGRNGAGKSTLLKVLSRITEPTSGRIIIRGRVSSLLEVGTGFHPELTGRDNIYMNGTILGMTKREIDRKFDEIVDFSGVEKFLDTPVKRYSSGMQVRLAFAVAAHLEPEILVIDEVLAVGDIEFQKKCLGKMQDVAEGGRTVLFVSHNMAAVQSLCSSGCLLSEGQIQARADTHEIVDRYNNSFNKVSQEALKDRRDREGNSSAKCIELWLEDQHSQRVNSITVGARGSLCIRYFDESPEIGLHFTIGIYDKNSSPLTQASTVYNPPNKHSKHSNGVARCHFDKLTLAPGNYHLNVAILRPNGEVCDRVEQAFTLRVTDGDFFGNGKSPNLQYSIFFTNHQWEISEFSASKNH